LAAPPPWAERVGLLPQFGVGFNAALGHRLEAQEDVGLASCASSLCERALHGYDENLMPVLRGERPAGNDQSVGSATR
jgi:hypothetical protein